MLDLSTFATRATAANRRIRRKLAAFGRHHKGIAATEFALVLPIMMAMYFGMLELSQAVGHDRKSVLLSRTLADMVTQSMAVTNADMATIFNAATSVLTPFPVENLAMRVTSYLIDAKGDAYVDWSDVKNYPTVTSFSALGRCTSGNAVIDKDLRAARTSLVRSEVLIKHMPTVGYILTPAGIEMKESLLMRPRVASAVTHEGVATSLCPGYVP